MPTKQKLFKSNKLQLKSPNLQKIILFWSKYQIYILLFGSLLIAALARFYHLNWDEGNMYHPDERNIDMAVARINVHQLNPHFFAYGSFPIYLIRVIGDLIVLVTQDSSWVEAWEKINLISRYLSAFTAVLSVYIFFLIIKKIINEKMAVLGAFLMATTVGLIQYAHYGVTESINIFYLLMIIYLTLLFLEHQKLRYWLWMVIIFGISLATKISNFIYIIIPLGGWLSLTVNRKLRYPVSNLLLLIFLSLTILFLFSPFNFLDYDHFIQSIQYERNVVSGQLLVPYTLQFSHTLAYIFPFLNLHWQMGLWLPTLGVIGLIIWLILILIKKQSHHSLMIALFGLVYFIYVGAWYTKYVRYMLPLIPILILGALWLINYLWSYKKLQTPIKILVTTIIITNIVWVYAYSAIYRYPHPWIAASKWIYQHIPAGSTLTTEEWDDRLPTAVKYSDSDQYTYLELSNFDEDNVDKITDLADKIAQADYIVLTSERVMGAITKNPEQYPLTSRYYQMLLQGRLGYKLIKTFSNYPRIGKFVINDKRAEETFWVYDHALVRIFQNKSHLSQQELFNQIMGN